MRRNSFMDEFGSIIKYTVIALMVIVLFFVCFAFSRKDRTLDGAGESSSETETQEQTPEETPEQTTEATTPEETTAPETQAPTTVTAEDGTVFAIVYETVYALDGLNVRKLPSTSAEKVGVLEPGTAVVRVGISETGWSMIEYEGIKAFVSSEFVGTTAP